MLCVCRRACQRRDNAGYIRTFKAGDVFDFEKCPTLFEPIEPVVEGMETVAVDFGTAKEPELLNAEYDLEDLRKYLKETYDKTTKITDKEKLVAMLIDCRYRAQ